MAQFNEVQAHQEDQYIFPYHYSDMISEHHRLLNSFDYLNRLKIVLNAVNTIKPKTVLDAGCGDGRVCLELNKLGYQVTGIDYSDRAVALAKAFNPEVEFLVQDLENLNMDKKFDTIILMEVLEHFIPEKIDIILAGLANRLNEGGRLIITVPSVNIPLNPKHYQHFTPESLARTVAKYFEVESVKGYAKKGSKKRYFNILKKLAYFAFPFKKKFFPARMLVDYTGNFYWNNLMEGRPEECNGLIAICKKK